MNDRDRTTPKDQQCWERLRRLNVGGARHLRRLLTATEQHAWYRAARKHGIRISIKTTPAGVTVWRIQ